MRRIVWHSVTPWAPTAYGQQTALMVRSLHAAGFEVVISADAGLDDGPVEWDGFSVHGSPLGLSGSLNLCADEVLRPGTDDLLLTLIDPFRLARQDLSRYNVMSWIPVHGDSMQWGMSDHLRTTGTAPVALTMHGAAVIEQAGFGSVPVIPHGIDLEVFRPLVPGDRVASRSEARRLLGIEEDRFVIGVVGTNVQPLVNRKAIPEILMAADALARTRDDVTVYLHTDMEGSWSSGEDLRHLVDHVTRGRVDVRATGIAAYRRGLTPHQVAIRYNAFDVLCAPSKTEGFCLPLIEAQACGVPVIASNTGSQPENVGVGWLVEGQPQWYSPDVSMWFQPFIASIVEALEEAYRHRGERWAEAVDFASSFNHDVVFAERWLPLLSGH